MSTRPLLLFDTNILMDVLLGRDDAAVLLVELAEQQHVDLVIPEYVLFEFRGTALRWIQVERGRLIEVRRAAKGWIRSQKLEIPADEIRAAVKCIEKKLSSLEAEVDAVLDRLRAVADIKKHTQELHFLGDLRYLQGLPPDGPVDGLKDCRIYETILKVAQCDVTDRTRYLVTKDSDFDYPALVEELAALGVHIRKDPGRLFGELRPK